MTLPTPRPGQAALYRDAPVGPASPHTYDVPEVARLLGVAPSTIYRAITAGTFGPKTIRISGGRVKVSRADVDHLLGLDSLS